MCFSHWKKIPCEFDSMKDIIIKDRCDQKWCPIYLNRSNFILSITWGKKFSEIFFINMKSFVFSSWRSVFNLPLDDGAFNWVETFNLKVISRHLLHNSKRIQTAKRKNQSIGSVCGFTFIFHSWINTLISSFKHRNRIKLSFVLTPFGCLNARIAL